jgi:hypothetical protein
MFSLPPLLANLVVSSVCPSCRYHTLLVSCLRRFQFRSLFSLNFPLLFGISNCSIFPSRILLQSTRFTNTYSSVVDFITSPPVSYSFSFGWRLLPIWQCNCLIFCFMSCSTGWFTSLLLFLLLFHVILLDALEYFVLLYSISNNMLINILLLATSLD